MLEDRLLGGAVPADGIESPGESAGSQSGAIARTLSSFSQASLTRESGVYPAIRVNVRATNSCQQPGKASWRIGSRSRNYSARRAAFPYSRMFRGGRGRRWARVPLGMSPVSCVSWPR